MLSVEYDHYKTQMGNTLEVFYILEIDRAGIQYGASLYTRIGKWFLGRENLFFLAFEFRLGQSVLCYNLAPYALIKLRAYPLYPISVTLQTK